MPRSQRIVMASFLASAVLAGGNGVGVRFSNRELDPFWGGAVRFGLAGLVLLAWAFGRGLRLPRRGEWIGPIVFGLLTYGVGFAFVYYGLVEIQAGMGQTILALVPLLTLLFAVLHRQERLTGLGVAGTLLATVGVAVLSGFSLSGSIPILSVVAVLAASMCFAEASVLVRRYPRVQPIAMNAIATPVGALALFVISLLAGETRSIPREPETWLAIAYLVVIGSVVVFVLYLLVLDEWPASRASYVFVIIPIVTIALSAWLDHEPVGLGLIGGAALVLGGVYLGALLTTDRSNA